MIPLVFALLLAQEKAVVEGIVVNALTGEPLKKARVTLNLDGITSYEVLSGDQGKFRFEGFAPETYELLAERQGFLDESQGWMDVAAGEHVKDVVLRMTPQSAVAGKVLDDDGDPVPGAGVLVERTIHIDGRAIVFERQKRVADDEGYFFAGSLPAGRYQITLTPPERDASNGPQEDFVRTEDPIPVDVRTGATVRNVEVRIRKGRVFRIAGRVANWPSFGIPVELMPAGTLARPQEGAFAFHGVAPGNYFLSDFAHRICPVPVTVSDHDLDRQLLEFVPIPTIAGTIRIEGKGRFAEPPAVFFQAVPKGTRYDAEAKADGTLAGVSLRPGKYTLDYRLPNGFYVKSVQFNHQPADRTLDVTSCTGGTLEIVVAPNPATLTATVPDAKTVKVTLWNEATLKTGETDDGSITFANLAPGEYRILAWEKVNDEYLEIPEFLDRFDAAKITLTEAAHPTVEVKLIPKSASDAEIAKLQ
jgi:hypothetical protein